MPAPAVALAGAALRNPRRTAPHRCSRSRPLGSGSSPDRRDRLDHGPAATAGGYGPSAVAARRHPAGDYLAALPHAGARTASTRGSSPPSAVETDHGRSPRPACAPASTRRLLRRPDAVLDRRPPSTWDRYGVDGNRDGRTRPYDPADAIPAAARCCAPPAPPPTTPRAVRLQPRRLVRRRRPRPPTPTAAPRPPTPARRSETANVAELLATRASCSRPCNAPTCAPAASTRG